MDLRRGAGAGKEGFGVQTMLMHSLFNERDQLLVELTDGRIPESLRDKPHLFTRDHAFPGHVMLNLTLYVVQELLRHEP